MKNLGLRKPVVPMLLVIIILFSSCGILPKEQEVDAPVLVTPEEIEYRMTEVQRGTISKTIEDVGVLVSKQQHNLYFSTGKGGNIASIKVKAGDEVKKGDLIAEINSEGLSSQIKENEILLKKAELEYERVKSTGGDSYAVKGAELDVELARLRLSEAKDELKRTKLYAPQAGTVVQVADIKIGDFVEAYQTIAVVANPASVQLELSGGSRSEYKVGMKAVVSYKNTFVNGRIVSVPDSNNSNNDARVVLNLEKIPEGAQIGDFMTVAIDVVKKENVLFLPKSAVKSYNNNHYVEYLQDGAKAVKYVQVGIETDSEYEIVNGLNEGEKVIAD